MAWVYCSKYNVGNTTFLNKEHIRTMDLINAEWYNNNLDKAFANCYNLYRIDNISDSANSMVETFFNCVNLSGRINITSTEITNAQNCFGETSLEKNVYIPFMYENGVNTLTYNAFIEAGYSTSERKDGVLLMDINLL